MQTAELRDLVVDALEDLKAVDLKVLDVHDRTSFTDTMVIASGNSDRHVKSLSDNVVQMAKAAGEQPLGVEGQDTGEWVLVDLGNVIVHVMLPRVRDFYQLEKLWTAPPASEQADPG
ncbi:MAG: ribosome silencing factor [Proteobacteria bacterium]|nr:MAG: ribosome silencing factor [Pseudomonadota bacterium]QKK11414.1 MAG: ribosome silencing factor [Pseudomonadota bacterium]